MAVVAFDSYQRLLCPWCEEVHANPSDGCTHVLSCYYFAWSLFGDFHIMSDIVFWAYFGVVSGSALVVLLEWFFLIWLFIETQRGCALMDASFVQYLLTNQPMPTPCFTHGKSDHDPDGKFKCMTNSAPPGQCHSAAAFKLILSTSYSFNDLQRRCSAVDSLHRPKFDPRNTFRAFIWPHRFSVCFAIYEWKESSSIHATWRFSPLIHNTTWFKTDKYPFCMGQNVVGLRCMDVRLPSMAPTRGTNLSSIY